MRDSIILLEKVDLLLWIVSWCKVATKSNYRYLFIEFIRVVSHLSISI